MFQGSKKLLSAVVICSIKRILLFLRLLIVRLSRGVGSISKIRCACSGIEGGKVAIWGIEEIVMLFLANCERLKRRV